MHRMCKYASDKGRQMHVESVSMTATRRQQMHKKKSVSITEGKEAADA